MLRGNDPVTLPQPALIDMMIEVEIGDLLREAHALAAQQRLSPQVVMALQVGLGCLKEAHRNPALRNVGDDLRVTVGHAQEVRNGSSV